MWSATGLSANAPRISVSYFMAKIGRNGGRRPLGWGINDLQDKENVMENKGWICPVCNCGVSPVEKRCPCVAQTMPYLPPVQIYYPSVPSYPHDTGVWVGTRCDTGGYVGGTTSAAVTTGTLSERNGTSAEFAKNITFT